jgi:adenosylcobinamide-GDP ribazoletransferase
MRAVLLALSFLTRIPVRTGEVSPRDVGASLQFFPLVGMLIGAGLALIAHFGESVLAGSALLSSFACVVFWALITGALHLDGVADLGDAPGGGRGDRARMLSIMRDPHVGAHGATALILVLAGKLFALVELLEIGTYWPVVALAPVIARFACALAMKLFAYARDEGLGRDFHAQASWQGVAIASLWPLCALLAVIVGLPHEPDLVGDLAWACAWGVAGSLLVAWRVSRLLAGITGDVHGAVIELCELFTLLAGATLARS